MPKIIEHLPQRLAEEARKQVLSSGYSALTIRSVASGCGVGVGTVYNYYPSKDALVAAFMLDDWKQCIHAIEVCAEQAQGWEPILWSMYETLSRFLQQYEGLFRDENAIASFSGAASRYHSLLRQQLAAPLQRFCRDSFTAQFIAEAMLTWTVAGTGFDELSRIFQRIF